MKKKVYIIHGWGGSPKEPMHSWLKQELEKREYEIIIPKMPNPEEPKIKSWVEKLNEIVKNPDNNSYFIGHSIGCQTIMRYLESLSYNIKIGGIVFIAPWFNLTNLNNEEELITKQWIETPIDFDKIKLHTKKIVAIFSDNDKFVPLSNKEIFKDKLMANIIVEHEKGHFTEEGGIVSNPTALNELLKMRID